MSLSRCLLNMLREWKSIENSNIRCTYTLRHVHERVEILYIGREGPGIVAEFSKEHIGEE